MRPAEEREEQETTCAPPRLSRWEALREGMPGERAIQEAMRRGEFDNLPGRGKPLRIDPSECAADAIVAGMLKEANVVPEWIEQARAIEEGQAAIAKAMDEARQQFAALEAAAAARLERCRAAGLAPPRRRRFRWPSPPAEEPRSLEEALRRLLEEGERRRTEAFAACFRRAAEVKRRMHRFNDLVPLANRQRTPLSLDRVAADFAAAWPKVRLATGADGLELHTEPVEPPRPALSPEGGAEAARRARDPLRVAELHALTRGRKPPPIG